MQKLLHPFPQFKKIEPPRRASKGGGGCQPARERLGIVPAMASDLQRCLKANWGHEKFRPHQLEVRA